MIKEWASQRGLKIKIETYWNVNMKLLLVLLVAKQN